MASLWTGLNFLSAFLSLFLAQGNAQVSSSPAFTLLYPPDRALFGGAGLTHLIIELNQAANLSVTLNGKPLADAKVRDKIYHYSLHLKFGLNRVEVEVVVGGELVGQEGREIFFFSPIAKEKEIPKGFASMPFHQAGKMVEKCAACHILEPQEVDLSPPNPKDSSCHICHRQLTQFKQVHGPAALWNCLACHAPNSSPARYSTPHPVRDLCYRCHQTQKKSFFSSRYQHGPTATGMCTICHNPHGSEHVYWLKKAPWDLCTTCHVEKASGRHVIAWGPTGDTHPTRGRPDPMRPERELACPSCHNPHASNSPKLWKFGATTYYQLCWTCHRK
ncbi:MAG: cytochrome c3 family protein [Candidatus Binatia bacterium]